ncbi:MAG TPA: hypothetical protein VGM64_15460 [Lacunisphaera sp.]|jgi:hypothetical protein
MAADTPATPGHPGAAPTGEPKTHALFMGTDISIQYKNKLYPLQDVVDTSFIVSVDGNKTSIPMRGEPHNLKLEQSLKLTNVSASLTGLTAERVYTPGNDPRMLRQIEASHAANAIGDNASLAEGKFIVAKNNFGVAINPNLGPGAAISAANLDASAAQASKDALAATQMADAQFNTDFANSGLAELRAESDRAEELYDAVEVNCVVSSPTELKSPYIVLVVQYRTHGNKTANSHNMIYARALDPIGARPYKIHILQGGLPHGYELVGYQLHLYNLGQEVATDVVPERVSLTREEAFEYVKADYLGMHKGATLPSAPAMGKLGLDTKAELTSAQLGGTYFVKVTKDGKPEEAFLDEACSQPVDDVVATVVKYVRFFPALDKGKRVEGVARLRFSYLTR